MGATLNAIPALSIEEQSLAVTAHVLSSTFFARSKVLSCYLSMPTSELSTNSLVSAILQSDKALFVPRIESATDAKMDFVKLYGEHDLSSLPTGLWGIKEPGRQQSGGEERSSGGFNICLYDGGDLTIVSCGYDQVMDATCEPLDLILLPGVAFDRSLSRLGHGKGFYDRFVRTYVSSGRQRPLLVGLALREQLLEAGKVPTEETDWKMDLIVTPDGIIGDVESVQN